ncbi:UDP-N-acetylglucosamine 2-epimerase [Cohnella sp. GCM10012308]|uniref:UDP-N-acetylglucosamine 2-epimerase n=1 Tax=Cohnella sp. GCM10012308 TaxID=3317329 RepID=UPI0036137D03
MENKQKIGVVTGTRADYGLLYYLLRELEADDRLELQLLVTGMHLSSEFGLTFRQIEEDGFRIDAKVEMLLSSDSPAGIAKSMGLGMIGFGDALAMLKPDLLVVLGDRYEMFAAAQAAMVAGIPLAHIAGGDTTEGAYDEAIRHSLTKMAHLHFVTNEVAAKRVRQMGENPAHVYNVGSPGIDYIKRMRLLTRREIEEQIGFKLCSRNLLITFHPVTLEAGSAVRQLDALFEACERLGPDVGLIFTKANADNDGRKINEALERFAQNRPNAAVYASLGQQRYLSVMAISSAVVGNSSSGLYEAPSFGVPTVNIGDRQRGRLAAASVISCLPEADAIERAIQEALARDCSDTINPYGDGNAAPRICRVIGDTVDYRTLLKKTFRDMEETK